MVVALSEEIWYRTYRTTLTTMDLTARLLRYVDNRLCLSDPSWDYEICFANFLHPEFYGHPIILETEPDQEFLGFCIEFEPFALRYSPSTRLQPGYGPILRITSCSPTFGFRLTIISGRQMCAPCTRTNARFCRIAPFVQSSRFLRIRFSCRCQAYPSIFAHLFIVVKSGAALTPVLTSHVSHPAERLTSSIHTLFYPMSVYWLSQLAHPQTRFHLYLGPYSTLRDGFFVSYNFNPDSRTSVSSISS